MECKDNINLLRAGDDLVSLSYIRFLDVPSNKNVETKV